MLSFTARVLFRADREELRFLPEGPRRLRLYPGEHPMLGWIAIQHGENSGVGSFQVLDLMTLQNTSRDLPGRPGFFAETSRPGTVLIGLERRLVLYDMLQGIVTETGIEVSQDERVIINDGVAIPQGLIFGTKHLKCSEEYAALYYFDAASRELKLLKDKQMCSNGKFLSGDLLVDIDSPRRVLTGYTLDRRGGSITAERTLADLHAFPGVPDGMRPVQAGGSVAVAFFNPEAAEHGTVRQVNLASGAVEAEWIAPGSPRVTCPEFVMLDGQVKLIFTTAVEGMPREMLDTSPNAGSLFIADTDFTELPPEPPLLAPDVFTK